MYTTVQVTRGVHHLQQEPRNITAPVTGSQYYLILMLNKLYSNFRFMGQQAEIPINLDSKSFKVTQENMKNPDRYVSGGEGSVAGRGGGGGLCTLFRE